MSKVAASWSATDFPHVIRAKEVSFVNVKTDVKGGGVLISD
ncbi:MAG TPA: hypothetical protein VEK57_13460 [Thermoanaerobaculia bacterium]|nr:hypothetical protein [Thermoanaerobaculia bacterium]